MSILRAKDQPHLFGQARLTKRQDLNNPLR
jgi:hypothetical protein